MAIFPVQTRPDHHQHVFHLSRVFGETILYVLRVSQKYTNLTDGLTNQLMRSINKLKDAWRHLNNIARRTRNMRATVE